MYDRIIDTLYELSDSSVYTLARIMHTSDFEQLQLTCTHMTEEGLLSRIPPTDLVRDTCYRLTEYGRRCFVPPTRKKRGVSSRAIKNDIRSKQDQLATMEDAVLVFLHAHGATTIFELERELTTTMVVVDRCLLSSTLYKLLFLDRLYAIGPVIGLHRNDAGSPIK